MTELSALAGTLGELLKERKETLAVAESSAGGLISAALLAVPGASAYFLGGAVVYTQVARRALLRVPDESVAGIRSSTEAYALLKAVVTLETGDGDRERNMWAFTKAALELLETSLRRR
jgi:PncC family amidohydrolase